MARWQEFEQEAGELAGLVRARFEATKHHVLATLRVGGAPRVSGTEVRFHHGDLTLGSMPGAVKARDLQRDGRFALHANPGDGSMAGGDSKISGRAIEVTDADGLARFAEEEKPPPGPFHLFVLRLEEVVHTSAADSGDHLIIEIWRPGEPVRRIERR